MIKFLKKLSVIFFVLFFAVSAWADSALQVDFILAGYRHPTTDKVLSGGKIYSFLDGTSTLSALWTDKDKGGAATNPVVLDSSGKAEIFGDGIYKFEIYDSGDVLIETLNGLTYKPKSVTVKSLSADYSCDLAVAVDAIGSTTTTLLIDCAVVIADGTTVTTPTTLALNIINGGSIDGVAGGSTETLAVNGPFNAGDYSVFGANITVNFGGGAIEAAKPEWWGAKGDADIDSGTGTDNYIAINAASNAYDTIKLSDKIYGTGQSLVFEQDLTIISDNATILGIPYTTGPRNLIVAGKTTQVLTDNEALDATASRGENEIYLPAAFLATLEVNEVILINSDKEYIGDTIALNINHAGELAKISSIEADHFKIYSNLNDTYTTGDNAKAVKVDTYTFSIIGELNLRSVANDVDGGVLLTLRWVKDSNVNANIISTHKDAVGINVYNCYDINVQTQMTAYGDGVVYSGASTNINIRGIIEVAGGHCVAGSGGNDPAGIPWNIDMEVDALSTGKAIDAHYGTGSIYIHDSNISGLVGIGISALYNTVANSKISARSDGIRIREPVDNILDVETFIVKDCEIETTGSYGMRFDKNDINFFEISDTKITGATTAGVFIEEGTVIRNWKFSGNTITDVESGLLINDADIELPRDLIIDNCKISSSSYAIFLGDATNSATAFVNLESVFIRDSVIDATYIIRLVGSVATEKTLNLLSLDNVLADVSIMGVHSMNFSMVDLKLENIESVNATIPHFVYLDHTGGGYNISVDTLSITGSYINSATKVARASEVDANDLYNRAIVGQNRLISNVIVFPTNQGAAYYEVLNSADDDAPFISRGDGSPESAIVADPGSIYFDTAGGANTTLYVKESGTGNTGWIAK